MHLDPCIVMSHRVKEQYLIRHEHVSLQARAQCLSIS
jgi:hypothetical protein